MGMPDNDNRAYLSRRWQQEVAAAAAAADPTIGNIHRVLAAGYLSRLAAAGADESQHTNPVSA